MNKFSKKRSLILNGNMAKVILILAGPIMLNNFIQTIYNLTDTYWVNKLGGTQMAAITLIWPVVFFLISIGMGMNIAGTSLISQYTGADDKKNAANIAGQLLAFSITFSIIIGLIGFFAAHQIVSMMGGTGELLRMAKDYIQVIFLGLPTIYIFLAFTAIKQGQGDTLTPMKYSAISVSLNIILDPLFIFVFGFGIKGAAIATVLARGFVAIIAIYTLFYDDIGIKLNLNHLKLNKKILNKIIKIGLPSSIGQSSAAFGFAVLNIFIISYGESTLAAFGLGNRINSLVMMPAMGIGNALATIVGQNLGAEQVKRARKSIKTSALLSTFFMVTGGILLYPFIPAVIKLFNNNPEIASQGITYLRLITLSLPLMGFFQIFVGTFQGSGHTIMAMIIMTGRLWILRIPMIIIFKYYSSWGSSAIWYAMILSNLITCFVGFGLYLTGKWEKKVIKNEKTSLAG